MKLQKTIGILGAGQMGRGIAQVFAAAHFKVQLFDTNPSALATAATAIAQSIKKLAEKNKLPPDTHAETALANITYHQELKDLASNPPPTHQESALLIIEAVVEDMAVKQKLYQQLKDLPLPPMILASNTSALSIAQLQKYAPNPKRFLGVHFMNPPPLMPLVEVISTDATDPAIAPLVFHLLEQDLKKSPIMVKDAPAFVLNRLLLPYLNEAVRLLESGVASKEDIDKAMMLGGGYKMGPLQLCDFIGLDTCHAILTTIAESTQNDHYRPAQLLTDMVKKGHLGRKTKKGFYDYEPI